MILALLAAISSQILSYEAQFDMKDASNAVLTVKERIQVNESAGEDAAYIVLYTDHYRKLSSFSGCLYYSGGKHKDIRKGDLQSFAPLDMIGGDACIHSYKPSAPYPYILEYTYRIDFKNGFASIPEFLPVRTKNTGLEKACYRVSVPAGTGLKIRTNCEYARNASASGKGADVYEWEVGGFRGISDSHYLPPLESILPYAYLAPESFRLDRFEGSQRTWKELGGSMSLLLDQAGGLPEKAKEKVLQLIANCPDEDSRIELLYRYLREKTRYVSIQFGLGGYRPFSCQETDQSGFGDCKALAFYMKNLLSVAGIESEYFILGTNRSGLEDDFPCLSFTNHAMLAVPRQSDTLWVECTNPSMPLGYRHSDVAGHDVLLVNGEKSGKVRVRSYDASENRLVNRFDINFSGDHEINIYCERTMGATMAEPWLGFSARSTQEREKMMTDVFSSQTDRPEFIGISDNFGKWSEHGFSPEIKVAFQTRSRSLIRPLGRGKALVINPAAPHLPSLPSERNCDIFIRNSRSITDICKIQLPAGREIKMPDDLELECEMGSFTSETKIEGNVITVTQTLVVNAGTYDKRSYESFRDFAQSVRKAQGLSAIIR